jgi:gamma-glutamyltranspeptidase / glutathione hydrolase
VHFTRIVLCSALVAGCGRAARFPAPSGGVAPGWTLSGRARVALGAQAMVVSGSDVASAVGRDLLRAGGSAVDAAVGVGFALAVVHPEAGNIGGGGFMLIRLRDGAVHALDYRETAPARATRDMFVDARGEPTERSLTGHLAAGVPGAVAGLIEAHRRYGRLPLARVIEPAIRLARDGFALDAYRSRSIQADSARLTAFPASRASYLPDGALPAPGQVLRQPDLARTLTAIRDRGADGFYRGPVAALIVAEMAQGPGVVPADLARPGGDTLPRLYPVLHATVVVGRGHAGRDPQPDGRFRGAAAVRLARAAAS